MKPIWRTVSKVTQHMRPGHEKSRFTGGSYRLHLPCGHDPMRKISAGIPERARCYRCEQLQGGAVSTTSWPHEPTERVETWDAATQLPKITIVNKKVPKHGDPRPRFPFR